MFNIKSVPQDGWLWQNPFPANINSLCSFLVNNDTGFVAGQANYILKTTDGGSSWKYIYLSGLKKINSIKFLNDSVGFAVGNYGLILRTTDCGEN